MCSSLFYVLAPEGKCSRSSLTPIYLQSRQGEILWGRPEAELTSNGLDWSGTLSI